MEIKMLNPNKISKKNREQFYEYMEEASKEFHEEANEYLDGLYSMKSALFYRPKKLWLKIFCYFISVGIIGGLASVVSNYIDIILHNQSLVLNCLLDCAMIITQLMLLIYILYNEMLEDPDYRHECYIKFINSDCVKRYEEKLLKKAFELDIELKVIRDKE